jgi:type 1 fimbria pilin
VVTIVYKILIVVFLAMFGQNARAYDCPATIGNYLITLASPVRLTPGGVSNDVPFTVSTISAPRLLCSNSNNGFNIQERLDFQVHPANETLTQTFLQPGVALASQALTMSFSVKGPTNTQAFTYTYVFPGGPYQTLTVPIGIAPFSNVPIDFTYNPAGQHLAFTMASNSPGGHSNGGVLLWFENANNLVANFTVAPFDVVPLIPTCSVSTPSINVSLGNVPASTLPSIGSTSPQVPFNVGINCAGGASGVTVPVSITLVDPTGTSNGGTGNGFTLLGLSAGSTAVGVAIQVLYQGVPITFSGDTTHGNPNEVHIGNAQNGLFNIPLTARYMRIPAPTQGVVLTPGTANSVAQFVMDYQ